MPSWFVFLLGAWIGAVLGFFLAAMLAAASRADEAAERRIQKLHIEVGPGLDEATRRLVR